MRRSALLLAALTGAMAGCQLLIGLEEPVASSSDEGGSPADGAAGDAGADADAGRADTGPIVDDFCGRQSATKWLCDDFNDDKRAFTVWSGHDDVGSLLELSTSHYTSAPRALHARLVDGGALHSYVFFERAGLPPSHVELDALIVGSPTTEIALLVVDTHTADDATSSGVLVGYARSGGSLELKPFGAPGQPATLRPPGADWFHVDLDVALDEGGTSASATASVRRPDVAVANGGPLSFDLLPYVRLSIGIGADGAASADAEVYVDNVYVR